MSGLFIYSIEFEESHHKEVLYTVSEQHVYAFMANIDSLIQARKSLYRKLLSPLCTDVSTPSVDGGYVGVMLFVSIKYIFRDFPLSEIKGKAPNLDKGGMYIFVDWF